MCCWLASPKSAGGVPAAPHLSGMSLYMASPADDERVRELYASPRGRRCGISALSQRTGQSAAPVSISLTPTRSPRLASRCSSDGSRCRSSPASLALAGGDRGLCTADSAVRLCAFHRRDRSRVRGARSPATGELLDRQLAHIVETAGRARRRMGPCRPAGGRASAAKHRAVFPHRSLPRPEPMDPYFGSFLGLLRRAGQRGIGVRIG
jgi:hypothetical protein